MNLKNTRHLVDISNRASAASKLEKPFRISAKRIFLTYSQVSQELTSQEVILQLCSNLKVFKYLIGAERHKNGGKHFHVLLESKSKFSIKKAHTLDIHFNEQCYHGNYQAARDYESIARYIAKGDDVLSNYTNFFHGEFLSVEEDMIRRVAHADEDELNAYYLENYPAHALKGMSIRNSKNYLKAVKDILEPQLEEETPKPNDTPFKIEHFRIPPAISKWMKQAAISHGNRRSRNGQICLLQGTFRNLQMEPVDL